MKKAISIIGGVSALLVIAIPAFARRHRRPQQMPGVDANVVMVENEANAVSNTGDNSLMTSRSRRRRGGGGVIETGDAYADAWADVTVNRQDNAGDSCGGCQSSGGSILDLNLVMVDNEANAVANTGGNRVRGGRRISSGNAQAMADSTVLVGVQVNDLN